MSDSVPYFPSKFSLYLKSLKGLKKSLLKIYPLNRTSFGPNDSISFSLPSGIVDPSTFAIHFAGTATNSAQANNTVSFPDNVESLINRYSVYCSGQLVNPPCMHTNQLANALIGLVSGDDIRSSSRSILSNGDSLDLQASPYTKHMWMTNFFGLLNSSTFLDTNILGDIRIELITESANCLAVHTNAQTANYVINDVYAVVEVYELDGEALQIYQSAMQAKMRSGGILIPFKNWSSISENVNGSSGSIKFSVATGCLNKLIAVATAPAAKTGTLAQVARTAGNRSAFFLQSKQGIKEWSVMMNGRQSVPISTDEMSYLTAMQSLGLSKDVSQGSLCSTTNWITGRFAMVHSFEYVGDANLDKSILGMDTRMSPNGYLNLSPDASNTNALVYVFLESTSLLRVLAPGVIQIEN